MTFAAQHRHADARAAGIVICPGVGFDEKLRFPTAKVALVESRFECWVSAPGGLNRLQSSALPIALAGIRLPYALIAGYLLHGLWDVTHELHAHAGLSVFEPGQTTAIPLAYGAFCAASAWQDISSPGVLIGMPAKHALGLVQYLRTIGYAAWIEDTNGNAIDEKALKMAIRSRHEDAPSS